MLYIELYICTHMSRLQQARSNPVAPPWLILLHLSHILLTLLNLLKWCCLRCRRIHFETLKEIGIHKVVKKPRTNEQTNKLSNKQTKTIATVAAASVAAEHGIFTFLDRNTHESFSEARKITYKSKETANSP